MPDPNQENCTGLSLFEDYNNGAASTQSGTHVANKDKEPCQSRARHLQVLSKQ